jgi:hypothetical protein
MLATAEQGRVGTRGPPDVVLKLLQTCGLPLQGMRIDPKVLVAVIAAAAAQQDAARVSLISVCMLIHQMQYNSNCSFLMAAELVH